MRGMISLIGEQPIPNLLPLRYLSPQEAVFLYTQLTKPVAERLHGLVESQMRVHNVEVPPYDIRAIQDAIQSWMDQHGQSADEWIFNLTGGTKIMALATYQAAANRKAAFVYLQSEGKRSLLYRYDFENDGYRMTESVELPSLIRIDDYLRAHVGQYEQRPPRQDLGSQFERAVADALREVVDEVMVGVTLKSVKSAVELDLVVRLRNQVGVIQAKTGSKARSKDGLRELNSACTREFLGTYTRKLLVINQRWDPTLDNLRELAREWQIDVVELPSFREDSPSLSREDTALLQERVRKALEG